MFNIVLFTPDIPNNTGTIGRLCVNTESTLHLIKPLGFDIDDKAVRRAGLDYWKILDLKVWENIDDFFKNNPLTNRFFFATTKTDQPYFSKEYKKGDYLCFGSETKGLPEYLLKTNKEKNITIPMGRNGRSLNLAISVGIVLYKAIESDFEHFQECME
jgi:tRNA (cytidine/uridine-2'-O-)-methyltransferase